MGAAIVGMGNLGRAIIDYFAGRRPKLRIVAAFDTDPAKIGNMIHGCRCYDVAKIQYVISELGIGLGIITVPAANAQEAADLLIMSGVKGLLNFAPVRLRAPHQVYVEDMDMTTSLERVAYFVQRRTAE